MRRRRRRSRGQGGFTLIEILVSLVVLTIGMVGIIAMQMTTVKANRLSRELERARVIGYSTMEDLRAKPASTLPAAGTYPTVQTPEGTTYSIAYTAAANPIDPGLILVTTTVTFAEDNDPTDTHSSVVTMLRTTTETF